MLKVDWLDFKDVRSTRSINSTFHWPVDSTRLHRQTIDSIGRLDRFRGLVNIQGALQYTIFFTRCLSDLYVKPARSCVTVKQIYEVTKSVMGLRSTCFTFFKKKNHNVLGRSQLLCRHANNIRKSLQRGRKLKANGSC